ncbi:MAG TPA: sensor histidine kinase [Anaerolineae bacterium]
MSAPALTLIFFFYGLAFFSMGLAITLEYGRSSDARLRHALRPLAAFGFIHAVHEWLEMAENLRAFPWQQNYPLAWESLRIMLLAYSFLSLSTFGASVLSPTANLRRVSGLVPLVQVAVWGFGALAFRSQYSLDGTLWQVLHVWTRYVLGVPAALLASAGLIAQQRAFRRAGLVQFGRDSLWAAVAFAWYGLVGQTFTNTSPLPPSNVINQELFMRLFGFPIQLLRACAAIMAAFFVTRFLRSFQVEAQRQIVALQEARLQEAERREALRGELLRRVVAAQESERQRIARELHDETGQALTAIGLGLRGASTTLYQDVEKVARNLRELEGLVGRALNELQRLIADLRPSHLDDLGLPAALRWYAGEVQSRVPLQVNVEVAGEPRPMPSAVNTALFRVVQEALTNVVKHAQAKTATVRLAYQPGAVGVQVEDDGRGFDIGTLANPNRPSWGLLGMEERATLVGGQFGLYSQPGKGTRVEVVIPDDRETKEHNGDSPVAGG